MNPYTTKVLEALKRSANPATADNARRILSGEGVTFSPISAEKLAATGQLGGFLKAVMMGDMTHIWQTADELNRQAIAYLIDRDIKNGQGGFDDEDNYP